MQRYWKALEEKKSPPKYVQKVSIIDFEISFKSLLELFDLGVKAATNFLEKNKQNFYQNNNDDIKLNYF